jgi:mono/diheme cytochrome c family protein
MKITSAKKTVMRSVAISLAVFTGACAVCFCVKAQDETMSVTAVYKTKCAVCHAADGSGSGTVGKQLTVPDFRSSEVQKHTNEQLELAILNGRGKMPGYTGKISADQIKQLVTYIRAFVPRK